MTFFNSCLNPYISNPDTNDQKPFLSRHKFINLTHTPIFPMNSYRKKIFYLFIYFIFYLISNAGTKYSGLEMMVCGCA